MKKINLFNQLLPSLQGGAGGRLLLAMIMAFVGVTRSMAQEAYAELSSSETTFTFYYDNQRTSRTGTTYDLNTGNHIPAWYGKTSDVTTVVFTPSFANVRPTTTLMWFYAMKNLNTITGISYLNTSEVTNMNEMFSGCKSLKSIDLTNFNTSNVTEMMMMFLNCWSLTSLDLSGFNTEKVKNMEGMFETCRELTAIYVGSNWTTTNVQSDYEMFYDCTKLVGGRGTAYDVSHVDKTYAHVDGGTANPGYLTDIAARQPYVVLSDNNTKLTFYYDGLKGVRGGVDLNTGDNEPAWIGANLVTTVVFDPSFAAARPTSTYSWFKNKALLNSITGLEYLNTSQVTDMESMFDLCANLESLDLSSFNTASVTKMRNMFSNCAELTSLNVKDWDTGNVTDMYGMFYGCTNLASLNVSNWNTGKVANMQNMFANCSALANLDMSEWNTASVTIMLSMFENCSSLTSLDLNSWNTGNVDLMYNMFKGCSNLARLKVSNWNTSKVTNMGSMFNGCSKLTTLDLSGWNTALVMNMSGMFAYCSLLRTISVGNGWSTSSVNTSANMFDSCIYLMGGAGTRYSSSHTDAGYAHLDGGTSNPGYLSGLPYAVFNSINEQLTFYFDGNQGSYGGGSSTLYYVNNDAVYPSWLEKKAAIKYVNFDASFAYARPTRTSYWFDEMTNLVSISNIENLNTSEVTTMNGMFYGCSTIKNLDLSSFDTGNVTDMVGMFTGCSSLLNLKVSNWNTSNVTNMSQMFFNCSSLATLDLSGWNTGNIGYISTMFSGCSNLTTIYAGSGWNVESVENSQNMFKDCTSLVGGAGTTFDAGKTDKTYARIDGVNGKKGYLSANPYVFLSSDNKTLTFYCDGKRTEREATGSVYNLNTGSNDPGWYDKRTSVTTVVFDASFAQARPTSTYNWFRGMSNLTTITNIRKLNTSSVTNMRYMFSACAKLTTLDLSSFNTENVTDMYGMFYNCTGLTSVDVSSFNTANVTLMTNMFYYCSKLTSLDLSSFNTANVTGMYGMFEGCSSLKTVFVSGSWNTDAVTSSTNMFKNCTSLEGGGGTTFDSGKTDKAYAHIDGGATNPGYFTATPYVVVSNHGKTLTFYCDGMPNGTHDGSYFNLNTGEKLPGWLIATDITTVVFDASFGGVLPTTTYHWFDNLQNLETITGMEYLNTSEVTDMTDMFQNCQKLTSLNLSKWNTSKVTNMNAMFYGCSALVSILVGDGWNTDNVTESDQMFSGCMNLKGGAGTTYDESHVDKAYARLDGGTTNPGYLSGEPYARYGIYSHELYFSCDGRRSYYENDSGYNVYDLNTGTTQPGWYDKHAEVATVRFEWTFAAARPTSTRCWFKDMTNIVGIDGLEYLNTSETTYMGWMFSGCSNLTSLDVSGFNTAKVTDMEHLFYDCSKVTSLDLSGFNTANVTSMNGMFKDGSQLKNLDLSSFNTGNVTNMDSLFYRCERLNTIYVGDGWSTAKVTTSDRMFMACAALKGSAGTAYNPLKVDKAYAHVDGGTGNPGYLTDISAREGYAVYTADNTTLTFYFDGLRAVRGGIALNTGSSEPGWKTDGTNASVTNVVFDSSFADARPTSTYYWFGGMSSLETITGLEYLNTSEVTNMQRMFSTCRKLTSLDVSHFDTGKVKNMSYLFYYCTGLTSLNVSGWNTANVTNMSTMFATCSKLTNLDLLSFNTEKVTNMATMFNQCLKLTTIMVGEGWSTAKVTSSSDMFTGCSVLKGSAGTTYDASHIDKTYARIDGGTVSPGYLTSLPYVVLNTDTQTLTYYSDGKKGTHTAATEVTCDLNGENFLDAWMGFQQGNYNNIKYAVIDPSFASARLTSMYMWFNGFNNLESITGMEYLNTSAVTDMHAMFGGCSKLTSLDLSHFDTSNVTDMSDMFSGCSALTGLDVSGFNTENVTDMNSMFSSCTGLTGLYLSSFNTANVATMRSMFSNCSALTTICVGDNWSTSGVPYLYNGQGMFAGCTALVGGNGTRFSSDHVDYDYARIDAAGTPGYFTAESQLPTEAYAMISEDSTTLTFYNDKLRLTRTNRTFDLNTDYNEPDWVSEGWNASITNVVFDPSFATARPTTTYEWFRDMTNLTTITGIEYLNTSEVSDMESMFDDCSSLTTLDVSSFNTAKVTSMRWMFYGCSSLTILDVSNFNTANVTNMSFMFDGCSNLTSLDVSSFNTAKVTNMSAMFENCSSLTTLDLSSFNTANVTDMCYMFENCSSLTTLDLSSFNTANVTNMGWMFLGCSSLTSLDLNSFITSNVTNMGWMFRGCSALTSLDVSSFNTANVTNMDRMFSYCSSLTTLDLSSFNTEKVTNMERMFSECSSLTTLDLSSFNTANVTDMCCMFSSCSSLTSLDVSSFNTANVTDMEGMFSWCDALTTIYVGTGWNTDAVTNSDGMFNVSCNLVGGNGTRYDSNHVDAEYAHVDVVGDPGYFTAIPYVVLSTDGTTLTFYHDGVYNKEGTAYNLIDWSLREESIGTAVTTAVFDPSFADARPITTAGWFYGMQNLEKIIDMQNLNTSKVTDMNSMFSGCSSLTELDLSYFDTSKVRYMYAMFVNCTNLTTIFVSNKWSTAAVAEHGSLSMFGGCEKLVGGNGTMYDSNHLDAEYACIDGGPESDTPGYLTLMSGPYAVLSTDGTKLTFYNDDNYDKEGTIYYLNSVGWISSSSLITTVMFDPSFASARPVSTAGWFNGMSKLTTITGIEFLNTSEVTDMTSMFSGCMKLTTLDLSHFDTSKVTAMNAMFAGSSGLTTLDLSSFNTANVINMHDMFVSCTSLTTIYVGSGWRTDAVNGSSSMFGGCTSLVGGNGTVYDGTHIDKEYAHVDGGPSYPGYFTSSGEPAAYAALSSDGKTLSFYHDNQRGAHPGTYDLNTGENEPGWYTDEKCLNVTSVVFDPSFADARPVSTAGWFCQMENLTDITDMKYLNTSEVTNMISMFAGCSNLPSLDVSNFNTAKVTDMSGMFLQCSSLTELDLSSFNTANVTGMDMMFAFNNNLKTIYVSDKWSTDKVTLNPSIPFGMFGFCESLVGGNGTEYNEDHIGMEYARIDDPANGKPGYFTYKDSMLLGDVNDDGEVNVADITALTNHLLGIGGSYNPDAADVDGSGTVTKADISALVQLVLNQ